MKKMKKIAIVLAAVLVTGVIIFYACEKEHITNPVTGTPQGAIVEEKDYEIQIEELIATTGIDIYQLSKLKEVKKFADKQLEMTSVLTTDAKGALTDEKLTQMQNLGKAISAARAVGNDYEVLRLYESLCAICKTIDGFVPGMHESGLQTFTYAPNKAPVQIPTTYMQTEKTNAIALVSAVQTAAPQFTTLTTPVQTQVLTAAISVNLQRNVMSTKAASDVCELCKCRKKAKADYEDAIAGILAKYGLAMVGCCFSEPAYFACIAVANAVAVVDAATATRAYERTIQTCTCK